MVPKAFPNVQAILFDLGGTLDGDGEHWLNRFHLLYQEVLPEVSGDDLKSAFYEAEAACLRDPQVATLGLAGLIEFHVRRQLAALGKSKHRSRHHAGVWREPVSNEQGGGQTSRRMRNSRPQARVWAAASILGHPLFQDSQ